MAYATLTQVKAAMSIGTADTADDVQITAALGAAEALIDGYCGRSFGTAGTAATTRVYAATDNYVLTIDDATTITLVETDPDFDGTWTEQWATTDWQAEPLNGRDGALSVPYYRLRAIGNYWFPDVPRAAVRVTAKWGWAAVPSAVEQATIQTAVRLFKRLDTPLGFGGGPDTGLLYVSRQIDGDVAQLLQPYRMGGYAFGGVA